MSSPRAASSITPEGRRLPSAQPSTTCTPHRSPSAQREAKAKAPCSVSPPGSGGGGATPEYPGARGEGAVRGGPPRLEGVGGDAELAGAPEEVVEQEPEPAGEPEPGADGVDAEPPGPAQAGGPLERLRVACC